MSPTEATETRIDLLRHGECAGGAIFRGTTDSPLTACGFSQMHEALDGLDGWEAVVSSPLRRCRTFAEHLAATRTLPLHVDAAFREIHFGVWEGRRIADVWREDRAVAEAYYREPGRVTPAGAEPLATASERLVAAWRGLLDRHRGRRVLLVVHGGVIRLLLTHLLGASLAGSVRWHVPHGTLARVRVHEDGDGELPRLVMLRPGGSAP